MSQQNGPAKGGTPPAPGSRIDTGAMPTPDAEATLDTSSSGTAPGTGEATAIKSIGPYRLVRKLGEGGMGQVWLAEQTAPLQRLVALKLIRVGMYDDSLLQRFQSERQSLAIMNHPCIAKVFDAGATPDGQPYFVMEYVPGVPISNYCDQKKLKIRERLELFLKVCEGVQHAHQKAIIHRDLKPANILVVDVDGKPTPRIIDFGLAKPASPQPAGEAMITQAGGFVGTPGYMSPEQADPSIEDIDTRTDVYSLGAVLYVLLTGSLPFDPRLWKKKPFDEVLRQLREEDPPQPSTKISSDRETQTATAEARGSEPGQLVSLLRGDLDCIAMKALERDRARRYGTPSELAADVGRYLHNQPIAARPASAGYRLKKYVLRHRVGVTVAAGLALLLAGFAVTQAVQLRRITRERDRANRITDFMTRMFNVSDPSESRGNSVTAREILDKASKEIDAGLTNEPQLQAQLMAVMGSVYRNLGLYPRSQSLLERAVEIRRRTLGPEHPETISSTIKLAATLADAGHLAEAEKLLRPVVETQRRTLGPENPDTLLSMNLLATTLHGQAHYAEAEKMYRQILEAQRRVLGPENPTTLTLMSNLAALLNDEGSHSPEIETLDRKTFDIRHRVLGPEHPDTLRSMANLGIALMTQGNRTAEAEKLLRETLDIQRRVLGPEHSDTITTMIDLASTLGQEHRYAEAEQLERDAIEIAHRVLGPEHYFTLQATANLAEFLESERHLPEADKVDRELLETLRRVRGPENPMTLQSMYTLSSILKDEGRFTEAETMLRQTRVIVARVLGPDSPRTALCIYGLACIAALEGKRADAFSLLREALDHGLDAPSALAIEKESDLKSLHGDPRFQPLVSYARERAAGYK